MRLKAGPGTTISRGEVVWVGQAFQGRVGRDSFLECDAPTLLPRERTAGGRA
ncbi:hypothetical protein [Xylophilus ampelinus]|uniref:Uncharacterized protein n=1 Tax=Xylophilus ampelinus TaxID=54067 RepID=A0A318SL59_9BURK|nr:hypothetical protein [Xylophilus ampelinus]MCS4509227.1 hypothetical protein [Xylophilus ampelinus]PYE79746.1 hypothetical protein DFQ15_10166 [Xylophilus ampelinus]